MILEKEIVDWGRERGIYRESTAAKQWDKLREETEELLLAIGKEDLRGIVDGIGDCIVVLTHIAHMNEVDVDNCVESAWHEIKDRRGQMVAGLWVKE